jgi:hypothetical protein
VQILNDGEAAAGCGGLLEAMRKKGLKLRGQNERVECIKRLIL